VLFRSYALFSSPPPPWWMERFRLDPPIDFPHACLSIALSAALLETPRTSFFKRSNLRHFPWTFFFHSSSPSRGVPSLAKVFPMTQAPSVFIRWLPLDSLEKAHVPIAVSPLVDSASSCSSLRSFVTVFCPLSSRTGFLRCQRDHYLPLQDGLFPYQML